MLQNTANIDQVQRERVDRFWNGLKDGQSWRADDLFLSERVVKTLADNKVLLAHFDAPGILSLLPFTPTIYVEVCRNCLTEKTASVFSSLVRTGSIIPILLGPYEEFPASLMTVIQSHDHMSCYEYAFYRQQMLFSIAEGGVCRHCLKREVDSFSKMVKRRKNANLYNRYLRNLVANLAPYVDFDFELVHLLHDAAKKNNTEGARQLANLGFAMHEIRSSQAFNAECVVNADLLSQIPKDISVGDGDSPDFSANVKQQLAAGLGLKLPVGNSVEEYIEIARAFQPRISSAINGAITASSDATKKLSLDEIVKRQMEINSEVERIAGLKRYLMLESAIDFFANNKALTATALIAGAMGLATGIVGCASGLIGGAASKFAKTKGWIKESESGKKLIRAVKNDVQPYVDLLLAKYTKSYVPAVSILTLRRDLGRAKKN